MKMRKRNQWLSLAMVLMCCAFFSNASCAQDALITEPKKPISVTAYALFNTTVADQTNVATYSGGRGNQIIAGGTGVCCGSLIGISGAADFGGGLGGVCQVETGFLFNTGGLDQEQEVFGRQAYAGFTTKAGKVFNVVTVGRQYDLAFLATAPLDPWTHGGQVFTAWDCGLFGVRFNNSIQDVLTVGSGKVMFSYSPGGIAGSNASGTSLSGAGLYAVKPFILGGVISHTQDATGHSLDVYGGGLHYTRKTLDLYSYAFDTLRDPDFGDNGNGQPAPIHDSSDAIADTSLAPNLGNTRQRKDHFVNVAARYEFKKEYSVIGMYKFDSARDVNSAGQHGTQSSYIGEFARGISPDFFVYGFGAYTHLTGAEIVDPINSPNGSFAGQGGRAYYGVGLNYRFTIELK